MSEKISKDPIEGWKWWQEAWIDTSGARIEFFVLGLGLAVVSLILGRFPVLKSITPHVLTPFLHLAAYEFSRNWRENKSKDFRILLALFKDQTLLKRLLPLSAAGAVFGFGYLSCNWLADRSLGFGTLRFVLGALESSAFLFAVPLVAFQGHEPFTALKKSLSTVFDNAPMFLVFYGVGVLSILAGLCSLGIGFLFLLPLYIYLPYLVFQRVQPR